MNPNDSRIEASTCKSSGTEPEKEEAWIARIQSLTVKETTSKAHMHVHTNKGSREKQPQPGRKPMPKWAYASRPGPTGPAHSGPGSRPLFALGACRFIASASAGRHIHPFIREPPTRRTSTGRKPPAAASPRSHLGDGLGLP
jgi:hypothetical protein